MKLSKKILRNEAVRALISWLGAQYIRLVHATGRWSVVRGETPQRYWDEGKPFILGFWHGRMLMMPYCWRRSANIHMLVSGHADGQLGANAMARLGVKSVAGSSSRGGALALRTLLKTLRGGDCVAIAPDGPRGPGMRASDGILSLARLSGAPIIPCAFSVTRGRVLSSWDRFLVAHPFARGVMVWGEPIEAPRDAPPEALAKTLKKVEDALTAVTAEADILCDREPVKPEPVSEEASPREMAP